MQYKNILYPVGGSSELADEARKHVAYLAQTTGARITLLFVEDKAAGWGGFVSASEEWKKIQDEWEKEGRKILDAEEEKLKQLSVQNMEKIIRAGSVPDEVIAQAEEMNADLIVLASQKKSPIGKLLMGSHTYNIFTKTPCPILRIVR